MLDKILSFIADWLQNYKPKITYYRLSALETINGTWIAPEDGFLRMSIASDGTSNGSYAYIRDVASDIDVLDIAVDGSSGYRRTNSVPVTKGRTYKLTHKSGLRDFVVVFYPLRGGYRKGWNFNAFSHRKVVGAC